MTEQNWDLTPIYDSFESDLFKNDIKKLEELGFVTRFKDSTDKRINRIYLTSKAFNIKNDFFSVLTKWENMLTNQLSPEEISESLTILNKLSKSVTRNN